MADRICAVEGCTKPIKSRDWCAKHYRRWLRHGDPIKTLYKRCDGTPEERFWAKVDQSEDCWIWTAGKLATGYGAICIDGKMVRAHRYSFELANGPIPEGMVIDHRCLNPLCVRPEHLRLATNKQNMEHRVPRSRVRGVSFQAGKWTAQVCHQGKAYYLGRFDNIEDAAAVAAAKRNELFSHNDLDRAT